MRRYKITLAWADGAASEHTQTAPNPYAAITQQFAAIPLGLRATVVGFIVEPV